MQCQHKLVKNHSPLLIGEVDRVLLVVVVNLFVQFAGLCGQLIDLTPAANQQDSLLSGKMDQQNKFKKLLPWWKHLLSSVKLYQ